MGSERISPGRKNRRSSMKRIGGKISAALLVVLVLLMSGILSGCATSTQEIRTAGDYGQSSGPVNASSPRNHAASLPEDPALQKSLPEMTAAEYEASGDLYFGQEDYAMAFVQYEKSLALTPGNMRIHFKQGMLCLRAGKPEEAVKFFQKVLEIDPGLAAAYEGMGTALFEMRQYDKAEKLFLKAVEMDPALWKARNYLGNIYDFQKKYDEASRQYAQAILLKPDEVVLYNNLGVSLSLAGRYEESVKAFQQALSAKGPKERVYNNLGLVLAKTGRYDGALDAFMKGSDTAKAYNNLGCVYLSRGEYRKAAQSFNKAIEVSPKFYTKADENLKKIVLESSSN
jgi:tetratricopeptide (TPR) repeat protein